MTKDELIDKAMEWFADCIRTLESKNHDYASSDEALSNFIFVGQIIRRFVERGVSPEHLSFATLMAVKMARLVELIDRPALHESIDDTFSDMINYLVLWRAFVESQRLPSSKDYPSAAS